MCWRAVADVFFLFTSFFFSDSRGQIKKKHHRAEQRRWNRRKKLVHNEKAENTENKFKRKLTIKTQRERIKREVKRSRKLLKLSTKLQIFCATKQDTACMHMNECAKELLPMIQRLEVSPPSTSIRQHISINCALNGQAISLLNSLNSSSHWSRMGQ